MFRDPLSISTTAAGRLAMTAPAFAARPALNPTRMPRLRDGVLEIGAGDGLRVAVGDVLSIDLAPVAGGRLLLTLRHRRCGEDLRHTVLVAAADLDRSQRLVAAVRRGIAARA